MGLPSIPLSRDVVRVGGEDLPIRSLSRDEAVRVVNFDDAATAEVFVIACGTDTSEDEAGAWRKVTSSPNVNLLLDAVMELSGLVPKDGADPKRSGNAGS